MSAAGGSPQGHPYTYHGRFRAAPSSGDPTCRPTLHAPAKPGREATQTARVHPTQDPNLQGALWTHGVWELLPVTLPLLPTEHRLSLHKNTSELPATCPFNFRHTVSQGHCPPHAVVNLIPRHFHEVSKPPPPRTRYLSWAFSVSSWTLCPWSRTTRHSVRTTALGPVLLVQGAELPPAGNPAAGRACERVGAPLRVTPSPRHVQILPGALRSETSAVWTLC